MRNILLLTFGLMLAAGALIAQTHDNSTERLARDTITFAFDVKIGNHLLPAGEYKVVCDKHQVTFTPTKNGRATEVECLGKALTTESRTTSTYTSIGPDGVRVLDKLYLKGSNVEHVFK